MRHLLSVVLSLILAPLIYIAAGYSAVKLGDATAARSIDWAAAGLGITGALFAGGAYSLLVMARLSPFGPVLAGLAYVGVTLWAVLDKAAFASAMPAALLGEKDVMLRPVGAGTLLLAVPLLFTIFSPRRWRRTPTPDGAAPLYPGAPITAAPPYGDANGAPYTPQVYSPAGSAAPLYTPGGSATSFYPPDGSATPLYTPGGPATAPGGMIYTPGEADEPATAASVAQPPTQPTPASAPDTATVATPDETRPL